MSKPMHGGEFPPVVCNDIEVEAGEQLVGNLVLLLLSMTLDPEHNNGTSLEAARAALKSARRTAATIRHLQARLIELEASARTDGLTGVLNRRSFEIAFAGILASARRYREGGIIAFIDLDNFKAINDTHGHAAGDALLRQTGRLLSAQVRESDIVGRVGGDEFAVVLSRSRSREGIQRARGLEAALNAASVSWQGGILPIQASFGIQVFAPDDDAAAILARADEAMYRNKRRRSVRGRIGLVAATPTMEIPAPATP